MPAAEPNDTSSNIRPNGRGFGRRTSMFIQVSPTNISLANDTQRMPRPLSYSTSSFHSPMLTPIPTPAATISGPLETPRRQPSHSSTRSVSPLALLPSHVSPRSLNRRQSITLQSSVTSQLSITPFRQPRPQQLVRPHTLYSYPTADPKNAHLDTGGSLPGSPVPAQRDRRRSMAYERYPPLGSIFESHYSELEAIGHTPRELEDAGEATMADDYFLHAPGAGGHGVLDSAAGGTVAYTGDPSHFGGQCGASDHGLITFGRLASNADHRRPDNNSILYASNELATADGEFCALRRQTGSHTSLASSVFSIASYSSTSSAASSYAYIFDSARPLVPSALASAPNTTTAFASSSSYAEEFACGIAVVPRGSKRARSASRVSAVNSLSTGTGRDILFMMDGIPASEAIGQIESVHATMATERSPLLLPRSSLHSERWSAEPADDSGVYSTSSIIVRETKSLLGTSSYLLISNILLATISISQVVSSGHLGHSELAGIGLAHMVVILTGYPMAFSVLSCLETCASQAYTSLQPQLVGAYFVRAIQLQWTLGLVIGALWFSAEPLLSYIMHGANPTMVAFAASYLRWYFAPFMVFSNTLCAKQVLYAQGITYPLPYLTLLGALTTMGAQYLLVFSPYFSLGVRGVALGSGLSYLAMLVATVWVIKRHNVARIWGGLRVKAPWRPILRLLPHCLALALFSTGTSELITMAATQLGAHSLSIQAVLSALSRMFMIASSSLGIAALNRTGNLIGRKAVRGARLSSSVSLCLGLVSAILAASLLLWKPVFWVRIFTNDAQVISDACEILPMVVMAFSAQSVAFLGSQLLSAQGRQALSVRIKFIALYAVGVPLGYYWTMVRDYGLFGLWAAVAVGQLCTAVIEYCVVLRTDWTHLVDRCAESITTAR
ncbi:ethionine resistance protein [Coemansia sp. Benny D115]|nr:ethionine resistance protein [Coemansia sp. Benny D115]